MSDALIAQLQTKEVTADEVKRIKDFIAEDRDSALSQFMQRILSAHSNGLTIDVFSDDAEVTPNEAAELLKMSRPHLLSFMDHGDLPFHRVGTHRRIKMSDLREFMAARDAGAKIVADAVQSSPPLPTDSDPLSQDELDELNDI